MSTRSAHLDRVKRRKHRPFSRVLTTVHDVYRVVRPLFQLALAVGGSWLVVHQLRQAAWHHNALVWLLGLFLALTGAVGLYKQVAYRVQFRRWLAEEDMAMVLREEKEMRRLVRGLPPWHHARLVEKRRAAREATGKRSLSPV